MSAPPGPDNEPDEPDEPVDLDEDDDLNVSDEFDESAFDEEPIEPSGQLQKWRRSTASGSIMGAVALGLREVFENPREEAPIVMEAPGEPPGPRRLQLELDPDDPGASTVTFRPWMEGDSIPPDDA